MNEDNNYELIAVCKQCAGEEFEKSEDESNVCVRCKIFLVDIEKRYL